MNTTTRIILLHAGCVVYTLVRYVAFNSDNVPHLPLLIVNKAVATAAAFCFAIAAGMMIRPGREISRQRAAWLRAGVFGSVWHVGMTVALLTPAYFAEFYAPDGRMTTVGETVAVTGALAATLVYWLTRRRVPVGIRHGLTIALAATLTGHTAMMGVARGVNMSASHGYLVPMWLLSAIGSAAALAWLILGVGRRRTN